MKTRINLLLLSVFGFCLGIPATAAEPTPQTNTVASALPAKLAFVPLDDNQYQFNTGVMRGVMRQDGKGHGPVPVFDVATGKSLARSVGWLSPYRLLTPEARFGKSCWEWPSKSALLPDGALEVSWAADDAHPLTMTAVYRWAEANTLDLVATLKPQCKVRHFEFFVGSYFDNFANAFVYARKNGYAKPAFLPAEPTAGVWQMFPRNDKAVQIIQDGRWKYPPNPVEWSIRPRMSLPLGMRRDADTGMTALVMAPPQDCFAVATPHNGEKHFSLYLCLIGRDLKPNEETTVRTRLVIGQNISDQKAVELYQSFLKSLVKRKPKAK